MILLDRNHDKFRNFVQDKSVLVICNAPHVMEVPIPSADLTIRFNDFLPNSHVGEKTDILCAGWVELSIVRPELTWVISSVPLGHQDGGLLRNMQHCMETLYPNANCFFPSDEVHTSFSNLGNTKSNGPWVTSGVSVVLQLLHYTCPAAIHVVGMGFFSASRMHYWEDRQVQTEMHDPEYEKCVIRLLVETSLITVDSITERILRK